MIRFAGQGWDAEGLTRCLRLGLRWAWREVLGTTETLGDAGVIGISGALWCYDVYGISNMKMNMSIVSLCISIYLSDMYIVCCICIIPTIFRQTWLAGNPSEKIPPSSVGSCSQRPSRLSNELLDHHHLGFWICINTQEEALSKQKQNATWDGKKTSWHFFDGKIIVGDHSGPFFVGCV